MMAAVADNQILPGDIFICKSYSLAPNVKHFGIRAGQALISTPTFGYGVSNSVHAAIAVGSSQDPTMLGRALVAEANGEGLNVAPIDAESAIFRLINPGDQDIANEAASIAENLTAISVSSDDGTGNRAYGKYAYMDCFTSSFKLRFMGADQNAKAAVAAVDQGADAATATTKSFFCSEFVVLCYQVAADKLGKPMPIPRNALAMTPKSLEAFLDYHSQIWTEVGRYNRPTGNIALCWAKRLFTRHRRTLNCAVEQRAAGDGAVSQAPSPAARR